jgi:hypothetical protein
MMYQTKAVTKKIDGGWMVLVVSTDACIKGYTLNDRIRYFTKGVYAFPSRDVARRALRDYMVRCPHMGVTGGLH